jgi:cytochrome c oxidase subunit II
MKKSTIVVIVVLAALAMALSACRAAPRSDSADANLSPEAKQGKEIYDKRCLRCHQVNGVGGTRASDLSKIGAQRDAEWLYRFTEDPQKVDPGNKMPTVFLTPEELQAVVKYMETLN